MPTPEALAALADCAAAALELTLSDESRAAVIVNLGLLLERAADFMDEPLPDALDPASLLRL